MRNTTAKFYAKLIVCRIGMVNKTLDLMDKLDEQMVLMGHLLQLSTVYQLQESDLPSITTIVHHTEKIIEIVKMQSEMMNDVAVSLTGADTIYLGDEEEEEVPVDQTESADVTNKVEDVNTQEYVNDK